MIVRSPVCVYFLFTSFLGVCAVLARATVSVDVDFIVKYPSAQLDRGTVLSLRGNLVPLSWDEDFPLTYVAKDTWSAAVRGIVCLSLPCQVQVKVRLDTGDWQSGPNSMCSVASAGDGIATCRVFPFFVSTNGEYNYVRNVYSPQLNNSRDIVVYTPPSWFENPYKVGYPVLIMHDGQNVFNSSTAFLGNSWHAQETLDALVNEEAIEELVVIAVDNTADRINELTYSVDPSVGQGGKADLYLDFIFETVLPMVTDVSGYLNGRASPSDWSMLGSSLGGLVSCYAGVTRSQLLTKVGCMSSSFWWNSEDFRLKVLPEYAQQAQASGLIIYVDSGDAGQSDDDVTQSSAVYQALLGDGWTANSSVLHFIDHGAQHSEVYWSKRFWRPLEFFYALH